MTDDERKRVVEALAYAQRRTDFFGPSGDPGKSTLINSSLSIPMPPGAASPSSGKCRPWASVKDFGIWFFRELCIYLLWGLVSAACFMIVTIVIVIFGR